MQECDAQAVRRLESRQAGDCGIWARGAGMVGQTHHQNENAVRYAMSRSQTMAAALPMNKVHATAAQKVRALYMRNPAV
jgi:hypothetical protein